MYTIDKKISRSIAAAALCAALALATPAFALDIDVNVKVPDKWDVPLDAESIENIKEGGEYSSAMVESSALDMDGSNVLDLYQASFKVVLNDQWQAWLRRYKSTKEADGSISMERGGDLNSSLTPVTAPLQRNIKFWSFDQNKFVVLDDSTKDEFANITKINDIKVKSGDELVSWDLSASPKTEYQNIKPVDAYITWLNGYDFSYQNALTGDDTVLFKRIHGMPDIGQSGIVVNGPPDIYDSLPGYRDWASHDDRKNRRPYLYVQTNDGLLHVVDPVNNMLETSALILPSSMLPGRLAAVKTDKDGAWIDVTSDASVVRSRPAYLLDGSLQLRHFNMVKNSGDPKDWSTYLIGTLGRAGNGIYMMDVDDPADPKLMWYRETVHNYTSEVDDHVAIISLRDGVLDIKERDIKWQAHDPDVDTRSPMDMPDDLRSAWFGFNMPKPGAAVIGKVDKETDTIDLRNIIVVGGGAKSRVTYDPAGEGHSELRNGTEGAAIYVLDAQTGETIRMFNSRSESVNEGSGGDQFGLNGENLGNVGYRGANVAMIVSEPTFFRTRETRYIASSAFLSSIHGKVFMVRFGDEAGVSSTDPNSWQFAALAYLAPADLSKHGNDAIPHGVAITRLSADTGNIWVVGVTADVFSRKDMGGKPDLQNQDQLMFSFETTSEPQGVGFVYDEEGDPIIDEEGRMMIFETQRGAMNNVDKDDDGASVDPNATQYDPYWGYIPIRPKGWYSMLDKAKGNYAAEYGTTRPLIAKIKGRQAMFVATFKQGLGNTPSKSNLYVLDVETGAPMLWSTDDIDKQTKGKSFTGIKINGLTLSEQGGRTSILVTYDRTNNTNDVNARLNDKGDREFLHKVGGDDIDAFVIDLGSNAVVHFNDGSSIVDYWMTK